MGLPKLNGKPLLVLTVVYSLCSIVVFGLITIYWLFGLVVSPFFLKGLIIQQDPKALIALGLVVIGGFSLISFIILNYKVFKHKIGLPQISKASHTSLIMGCLICLPVVPDYGIGLIPIALVICLYYLCYHNDNAHKAAANPTSQTPQPQEQA